ncbi:MAG: radical SAM protein [Oscillospiraceae bacterium]|jgi:uncharacterized Fe-S cluster-containing radical SAM superfamily protein|nr:radical SAM protein [Oscillospiraceae bacterium]
MLTTERLNHGGVMANYRCSAACRHCLYACSPERADGYITKEIAEAMSTLLKTGGCRAVHIGGGEPFLSFDGLLMLVRTLKNAGIFVEFIETNAYWVADTKKCKEMLRELLNAGANTFCISLDPFHAEYIPLELPLSLAKICNNTGFNYFIWQERYLPVMARLDKSKKHNRAEMEELISSQYIFETSKSYGIRFGGRAIGIEAEFLESKPYSDVISNYPCHNLLSGGHFHVDMLGRYIPPGCTGIAISLSEVVKGIPNGKYPVFEALFNGGTKALLEYAMSKGFTINEDGYPSNCSLCFYIRKWLSENAPSPELDSEHYIESMKYW